MSQETPVRASHPDDALDLAEYLRLVWRQRWVIVLGTLLAGGLALVVTLLPGRQFEAQATLKLVEPGTRGRAAEATAAKVLLMDALTSQATADAVVRRCRLNDPPHGLTAASFLERLHVVAVPGSSLIRANFRLSDPVLAARALNVSIEQAFVTARQQNDANREASTRILASQLRVAAERLERAEGALLASRREAGQAARPPDPGGAVAAAGGRRGFADQEVRILSRPERDYSLASKVYEAVFKRFQLLDIEKAAGIPDAQIVAPAVPPIQPVSRRVGQSVVLMMAVAFPLLALASLVFEFLRAGGPARRSDAEGVSR